MVHLKVHIVGDNADRPVIHVVFAGNDAEFVGQVEVPVVIRPCFLSKIGFPNGKRALKPVIFPVIASAIARTKSNA